MSSKFARIRARKLGLPDPDPPIVEVTEIPNADETIVFENDPELSEEERQRILQEQKEKALMRWGLIRDNLRRIIAIDAMAKARGDVSYKMDISHYPRVISFFRYMLIVSLFIAAFGLTGYQWSQWYTTGRQSTYTASIEDLNFTMTSAQLYINNFFNEVQFVIRANLKYQNIHILDWGDFSTSSLGINLDVLLNEIKTANSNVLSISIGYSDANCYGGSFLGIFKDGNKYYARVRNSHITQCQYNQYVLSNKIGNQFDSNLFYSNLDPLFQPQMQTWYINARSTGTLGWLPPSLYSSSSYTAAVVTVYQPIFITGNPPTFQGALAVDIDLAIISQGLFEIMDLYNIDSVAYITSSDGVLMATSRLKSGVLVDNKITTPMKSQDPNINYSANLLFNTYGSWAILPANLNITINNLQISVRNINLGTGSNWKLVVAISLEEYYGTVDNNLLVTYYIGVPLFFIMAVVVIFVFGFSGRVEMKRFRAGLIKQSSEVEERAVKLAQKRERERYKATSLDGKLPPYLANFDPDETWLDLALKEEKGLVLPNIDDLVQTHMRNRMGIRVSHGVIILMLTVVIVNMALWLAWNGTIRDSQYRDSYGNIEKVSKAVMDLITSTVDQSARASLHFTDIYKSTAGAGSSLLSALDSITVDKPAPSTIPINLNTLQSTLCFLRKDFSIASLYVVTLKGVYLECALDEKNNEVIIARDSLTSGSLIQYRATSSYDRGLPSKTIFSMYDPTTPWCFVNTIVNGQYGWCDNIVDPRLNKWTMNFASPLPAIDLKTFTLIPRTFLGIVGSRLNWEFLVKDMRVANTAYKSATTFLLDMYGEVMVSSFGQSLTTAGTPARAVYSPFETIRKAALYVVVEKGLSSFANHEVNLVRAPAIFSGQISSEFAGPKYVLCMTVNNSEIYEHVETTDRFTFWLLFTEFTAIATVAAILLARMDIDRENMVTGNGSRKFKDIELEFQRLHAEFQRLGSHHSRIRHLDSIKSIYQHLNVRRSYYFPDEIITHGNHNEAIDYEELLPQRHQNWLNYLRMAELNVNVENVWVLKHFYGPNSKSLRLYQFETSFLYRAFIYLMTIGLCLMAFFEPSNWAIFYPRSSIDWGVMSAELFFIVCIIFDTILQTFSAVQLKSFKSHHLFIQVFFSCCFLADWIGFAVAGVPRWSRLLRPLSFVYHVPQIRRVAMLIIESMLNAKYVILLFFYVIVMAAIIAIPLVENLTVYDTDGDFTATNFNTFYSAFINMFILIASSLNYADCFDPTIQVSRWYMLFWVTITIVGSFFILSTLIAQFSNTYSVYNNNCKLRIRTRRWMALAATFIIFDSKNKGSLTRRDFTVFLASYLRTRFPEFNYLISMNESNQIKEVRTSLSDQNSVELSLDVPGVPDYLKYVIYGCFHVVDSSGDGSISVDEFEKGFDLGVLSYTIASKSDRFHQVSKQMWYFLVFRCLSPLVLLAYVLILGAYNSVFDGNEKSLDIILSGLLLFMVIELFIRVVFIYGGSFFRYFNESDCDVRFVNRIDFILILFSCISAIGLWAYAIQQKSFQPFSGANTIYRSFLCIASLRIFTINNYIQRVVVVLVELAPACFEIMIIVLVLFYEYASLGGVFFSGMQFPPRSINFDTFLNSWIFMYWLYIADSWNVPMGQAVAETSNAALWFFITWAFLVTTMLSNLLIGVVIMKFKDFLSDQTKRLVDSRIRDFLTDGELTQLRTMSEKVISWATAHKGNKNISRAKSAISSLRLGFSSNKNVGFDHRQAADRLLHEADCDFVPYNLRSMEVYELIDYYRRVETEIKARKKKGILTDADLDINCDPFQLLSQTSAAMAKKRAKEIHERFVANEQSLISQIIGTNIVYSGGDVIEFNHELYNTPRERLQQREREYMEAILRQQQQEAELAALEEEMHKKSLQMKILGVQEDSVEVSAYQREMGEREIRMMKVNQFSSQWEKFKIESEKEKMEEIMLRKEEVKKRRLETARARLELTKAMCISTPDDVNCSFISSYLSENMTVSDFEEKNKTDRTHENELGLDDSNMETPATDRSFSSVNSMDLWRKKSGDLELFKTKNKADLLRSMCLRSENGTEKNINYNTLALFCSKLSAKDLLRVVAIASSTCGKAKLAQGHLQSAIEFVQESKSFQ